MPEDQAPPVVAVVVASDSGPWFERCLAALAAQDYSDLTALVVDAASLEPLAPRVARRSRRASTSPGWGRTPVSARARTRRADIVAGATYYLFCHDDVAPEPDAVRVMVEEALLQNAGIVGPKLVDAAEPDHILQLGLSMDRFGAPLRRVERREFDQSQHDEPREVFADPRRLHAGAGRPVRRHRGFRPGDLDVRRGHRPVLAGPHRRRPDLRHTAGDRRPPGGDRRAAPAPPGGPRPAVAPHAARARARRTTGPPGGPASSSSCSFRASSRSSTSPWSGGVGEPAR